MKVLYRINRDKVLRASHLNPLIQQACAELLSTPLSEKSRELLHTLCTAREVVA